MRVKRGRRAEDEREREREREKEERQKEGQFLQKVDLTVHTTHAGHLMNHLLANP